MEAIVQVEAIERKIYLIRGQKVMLRTDLETLYGVEARALKQALNWNIARFQEDFMLQLKSSEGEWLVSHNVIPAKKYLGGYLPYAFTEQGVAMLFSILKSERAVRSTPPLCGPL